jgi:tripartite-type tricarboxylate transporter receptor subunit TctC
VNWFTLMAPRSVPEDIVQRLVEANRTVLRDTSVGERLRAAGYTPAPGASAELSDLIAREFRVFGEVVRANNIQSDRSGQAGRRGPVAMRPVRRPAPDWRV